jgi:hypothetical protein
MDKWTSSPTTLLLIDIHTSYNLLQLEICVTRTDSAESSRSTVNVGHHDQIIRTPECKDGGRMKVVKRTLNERVVESTRTVSTEQ